MSSEKQWVSHIKEKLEVGLRSLASDDIQVKVETGQKLSYANEILCYDNDSLMTSQMKYETDMLIFDQSKSGEIWTPRIIIEAKYDSVTTHDALVYSSKAATHKQVHPYLRYGIIIGAFGQYKLPPRLARHGAYFDFMMIFEKFEPSEKEWSDFVQIVKDEIDASRTLQQFLTDRSRNAKKYKLLHRPLRIE